MYRIEKRYEVRVTGGEKEWTQWFPYFTPEKEVKTEEELKPKLKLIKSNKDSVNRKLHIKEEFRIAEFTPWKPKVKKKKTTAKKK